MNKRVLLCIMDGWGVDGKCPKNATLVANTPNFDKLKNEEQYTQIYADSENVGLPEDQMGNSEVGHLNLGAGRVVYQDLAKINKAIKDGSFFNNEEFLKAIKHVKANKSSLHLMGLVSNGGVHSLDSHIIALIDLAARQGLTDVYVHAFLDGRDTPPQSALIYLEKIENKLKSLQLPPIASVMGRYWAMDRDNRWDRVEKAYNCLLCAEGGKAESAKKAVENSYIKGENDEFVLPTVINGQKSRIMDNDAVIFCNFRPDRAREITKAVTFDDFDGFERMEVRKNLYFVTFTEYDETFTTPVAFTRQKLTNILTDVLDANGIQQFRTAETEKYAHITFFFNGGVEDKKDSETRVLVSSPKVATYDLKPEMSAYEVCDKVLEALSEPKYGFILVNFANPDMVGHTGVMEAAIKACETVDTCIGKIAQKCKETNTVMLLTADHGNAECMEDVKTHAPFTAHTTNPVPFFIINSDRKLRPDAQKGSLCDVAPTILDLMNTDKPVEMTGNSLIC